jgi:hypothetical protein
MSENEYDFSDVAHGPGVDQQSKLRDLVKKIARAQGRVERIKLITERAAKSHATYRDDLVPSHMRTMGITKQQVDGYDVSSGDAIEGSLPKDPTERAWAVAWLDANGGGPLVNREITITLPRDSAATEKRILEWLAQNFSKEGESPAIKGIEVSLSVHHGSLKSHAKKLFERGVAVPFKQLGLTLLKRAKVSRIK